MNKKLAQYIDREIAKLHIASSYDELKEFALRMAQWQREEDLKKCRGCRNKDLTFWDGMRRAKEELMKDAIEGEVIENGDFIKFTDGKYIDLNPTMGAEPLVKFQEGDKVSIIIMKQ